MSIAQFVEIDNLKDKIEELEKEIEILKLQVIAVGEISDL